MRPSDDTAQSVERPTVEDIMPKQCTVCPVEGCGKSFQHGRALTFHLVKTHRIVKNATDQALLARKRLSRSPEPPEARTKYYCPEPVCWYHENSPFSSMKRIKEHYVNVHAEKKYVCPNCDLGFGAERALKRHRLTVCGMTYDCGGCTTEFTSKTAMQTHCRKREHSWGRIIADRFNALKDGPNAENASPSSTNAQATTTIVSVTPSKTTRDTACGLDIQVTEMSASATDTANNGTSTTDAGTSSSTSTSSANSSQTNNSSTAENSGAVPPVIVVNVMQVFCADPSLSPYIKGKDGQRMVLPSTASISDCNSTSGNITCSTQTSGDFILERAMNKAKIPTAKKVSIGSQVSPKSRVQKSPKNMRTACVQTKKRKKLPRTKLNPLPSVDDIFCLSDVETQTNTLIEELQASLGASISTQTKDSFLSTNPEPDCPPLPVLPPSVVAIPEYISPGVPGIAAMTDTFGISTSTDFPPLDTNFGLGFNSNQTQTMDSMFEQLLNNMETQTPFEDFGFGIDNETQTVAPQSVETQTSLHGRVHIGTNVESTSIETQTMATDFDPSLFEFAQLISGMQSGGQFGHV